MKDNRSNQSRDMDDFDDIHKNLDIDKIKLKLFNLRRGQGPEDEHLGLPPGDLSSKLRQLNQKLGDYNSEEQGGKTSEKKETENMAQNALNGFKMNSDALTKSETCRNSVQGKVLISDDKGYVCLRKDLTIGGCCEPERPSTKLHSCETCLDNGCCSIYEYCISCCMEPAKKPMLQKLISKSSEGAGPLGGGGASIDVLFASITDHFEFCLAKCRTSSQSVQHENSYRDPKAKHCYAEGLPFNGSKTIKEKSKSEIKNLPNES